METRAGNAFFPRLSWLKHNLLEKDNDRIKNREEIMDGEGEDCLSMSMDKVTTIASCFLMDYEAGRPPTFSHKFHTISNEQIRLFQMEFSWWWKYFGIYPATILLFISHFNNNLWTVLMHLFSVSIFLVDLYVRRRLYHDEWFTQDHQRQKEEHLHKALLVYLLFLGVQSLLWYFMENPADHLSTLIISLFKPLVFFYLSKRARDALEALVKIGKILFRVILIELFLILTFAAVACRLYYDEEGFESLPIAWLSLFQCESLVPTTSRLSHTGYLP